MPRNVASARSTSTSLSECNRPIVDPILSRGTVCVLSIITWDFFRSPLPSVGSTGIRNSSRLSNHLATTM